VFGYFDFCYSLRSHGYFDRNLGIDTVVVSTGYLMRYTKETTSAMEVDETMWILTTLSNS
jgi:hypothetical protein